MKLVSQAKLLPTPKQATALKETMKRANEACDYISEVAWDTYTFGKFRLQKLVYAHVKETFSLTAQVVIRCIAKVYDAYKLDKKTKRSFKPLGAISYDSRILRYKIAKGMVSIWTVTGRTDVAFMCGKRQWELLQSQQGESDLAFVRGKFYLLSTCEVETPTPEDIEGYLWVDAGIVNLATDSEVRSTAARRLTGYAASIAVCERVSKSAVLIRLSANSRNSPVVSGGFLPTQIMSSAKLL